MKKARKQRAHADVARKIDFVSRLFSKEIALKVFSFLSLQDLVQCAVVSPQWSNLANDEMLWKPLFMDRFHHSKHTIYNERLSVKRYEGSWKRKYKIHHNWQIGNCRITDFDNMFDNSQQQDMKYHLQFQHHTLFIANTQNSVIDVWKYNIGTLSYGRKEQLQSVELALYPNIYITFLKIVPENRYLIAGYSNGGFTCWKLDTADPEQILNYFPDTINTHDPVVDVSMNDLIIILNTESNKLYIFRIHNRSSCEAVDLIHYLESPFCWSPIAVDIQKLANQQWKVLICCGVSGQDHSIWIMEVILSLYSVISTRQGYKTLSYTSPYYHTSSRITSMAFVPPYLVTAHPNNTMKQYQIIDDKHSIDAPSSGLSLSFTQTLYGHTFKVDALSMDHNKLLSADKSGIKIWQLPQSQKGEISLHNYPNQSTMNELPDATIETLDFDEDKIVAIVYSKSSGYSLRVWSFNI